MSTSCMKESKQRRTYHQLPEAIVNLNKDRVGNKSKQTVKIVCLNEIIVAYEKEKTLYNPADNWSYLTKDYHSNLSHKNYRPRNYLTKVISHKVV